MPVRAQAVAAATGPSEPRAATPASGTLATLVIDAVREYRESGVARTVTAGGVSATPYGHGQPVLACAVLWACAVELEPGERLVHPPIAGDQARWIVDQARAGPDGGSALVVVKPKSCGIATNLVLSTDRRIYDVLLDSPKCARSAGRKVEDSLRSETAGRVRRMRFYYPDEPTANGSSVVADAASQGIAGSATAEREPTESPINRDYHVVRGRRFLFWRERVRFPWRPADVHDDGAHVYLVLPPEARQHPAPVLYALEDDGSRSLVNTTLLGDTLVTDRTFRRAALVAVGGGAEQRLVLENRAWGRAGVPTAAPAAGGREP
jgi:type IV secretion system protein VirB9